MIEINDNFRPPTKLLFQLINSSFVRDEFVHVCQTFPTTTAVRFDSETVDVTFDDGATLLAFLESDQVVVAVLNIAQWWAPNDDIDIPLMSERDEFVQLYLTVLQEAIMSMGSPLHSGKDEKRGDVPFSIWRGETGIIVLFLDGHDPQMGDLVLSFWLVPWASFEPIPTSAPEDWLTI